MKNWPKLSSIDSTARGGRGSACCGSRTGQKSFSAMFCRARRGFSTHMATWVSTEQRHAMTNSLKIQARRQSRNHCARGHAGADGIRGKKSSPWRYATRRSAHTGGYWKNSRVCLACAPPAYFRSFIIRARESKMTRSATEKSAIFFFFPLLSRLIKEPFSLQISYQVLVLFNWNSLGR